jgi:hypothetical protein
MIEVRQAECALYFWFGERTGRILAVTERDGQWEAFAEHAPGETLMDMWEDGLWRSNTSRGLSRGQAIVRLARKLARRRQGAYEYMGPRQHKLPHWQPAWTKAGE